MCPVYIVNFFGTIPEDIDLPSFVIQKHCWAWETLTFDLAWETGRYLALKAPSFPQKFWTAGQSLNLSSCHARPSCNFSGFNRSHYTVNIMSTAPAVSLRPYYKNKTIRLREPHRMVKKWTWGGYTKMSKSPTDSCSIKLSIWRWKVLIQ